MGRFDTLDSLWGGCVSPAPRCQRVSGCLASQLLHSWAEISTCSPTRAPQPLLSPERVLSTRAPEEACICKVPHSEKPLQTEQLQQQRFIFSHFLGLKVQDQGVPCFCFSYSFSNLLRAFGCCHVGPHLQGCPWCPLCVLISFSKTELVPTLKV